MVHPVNVADAFDCNSLAGLDEPSYFFIDLPRPGRHSFAFCSNERASNAPKPLDDSRPDLQGPLGTLPARVVCRRINMRDSCSMAAFLGGSPGRASAGTHELHWHSEPGFLRQLTKQKAQEKFGRR